MGLVITLITAGGITFVTYGIPMIKALYSRALGIVKTSKDTIEVIGERGIKQAVEIINEFDEKYYRGYTYKTAFESRYCYDSYVEMTVLRYLGRYGQVEDERVIELLKRSLRGKDAGNRLVLTRPAEKAEVLHCLFYFKI